MRKILLAIGLLVTMSGFAFAQLPVITSPTDSDPWFLGITDGIGDTVIFRETSILGASLIFSSGTVGAAAPTGTAGSGVISWNGSIGTNWIVTVDTGIAAPTLPAANIHLNSVDVNAGGGNLTVLFSQTNVLQGFPGWDLSFGGTMGEPANSTITMTGCLDNTNAVFGCATSSGTVGPFGPGAFSGTGSLAGPGAPLYSLTDIITVAATGAGNWSADGVMSPVPEPASLTLLGSGLLGLAGFARRKFSKKS